MSAEVTVVEAKKLDNEKNEVVETNENEDPNVATADPAKKKKKKNKNKNKAATDEADTADVKILTDNLEKAKIGKLLSIWFLIYIILVLQFYIVVF